MRRNAFTIIELLVVLGIVAVLLGLLFPVVGAAKRSSNVSSTKELIFRLRDGISSYEAQVGRYPYPLVRDSLIPVYPYGVESNRDLVTDFTDRTRNGAPHIAFNERDIKGGLVIDVWRNPIHWSICKHLEGSRVEWQDAFGRYSHLYSFGPNGIDDSDDDRDGLLNAPELQDKRGDDVVSW